MKRLAMMEAKIVLSQSHPWRIRNIDMSHPALGRILPFSWHFWGKMIFRLSGLVGCGLVPWRVCHTYVVIWYLVKWCHVLKMHYADKHRIDSCDKQPTEWEDIIELMNGMNWAQEFPFPCGDLAWCHSSWITSQVFEYKIFTSVVFQGWATNRFTVNHPPELFAPEKLPKPNRKGLSSFPIIF